MAVSRCSHIREEEGAGGAHQRHTGSSGPHPKQATCHVAASPKSDSSSAASAWAKPRQATQLSSLTLYIFHSAIDAEKKPLRYMAGMLRTCQLEKMMTKEELEEEQRVQREQLAAIFQLLKDKQDTFGEVTESDLQEQLKLYSV
uniref:Matrix-remodelling associated 7 n=1 Tax=Sinocyclocheilus anshuiensis TaxID=1608454 RepID=A0A671LC33_9TELE